MRSKYSILPVLFLIIMSVDSWAGCTGSSPVWTSTPDYSSVNSCVSSASPGDTIKVSSGPATWSSPLEIRKGINLAGVGNPTITAGGATLIIYAPSAANASNNYKLRITGFTFNLGSRRGIGFCSSGKYGMCDQANSYYMGAGTAQTKIRIDHNTFIGTGVAIEVAGAFRGVVDNNTFDGFSGPQRAWGTGVGQSDWDNFGPLTYGTSDNMYYEDNNFTNIGGYMISDCDFGGRYTYRYNTISLRGDLTPMFDYHEGSKTSGDHWGCFGGEIYGNKTILNGHNANLLSQRAGTVLAFYNDVGTGAGSISVYHEAGQACPPTDHYNDQLIHNSYYWRNRKGATGESVNAVLGADGCGYISENKSFYKDSALCVDGGACTAGVGCGSSLPSTCTTGAGFWVTNQSCSDLTGLVGRNPARPIQGDLYKCTATNTWTKYYTPLPYPHPLTAPDPPKFPK